jgi:hypothetical protein
LGAHFSRPARAYSRAGRSNLLTTRKNARGQFTGWLLPFGAVT